MPAFATQKTRRAELARPAAQSPSAVEKFKLFLNADLAGIWLANNPEISKKFWGAWLEQSPQILTIKPTSTPTRLRESLLAFVPRLSNFRIAQEDIDID